MSTIQPPAPENYQAQDQPQFASAKDAKAQAKAAKAYRKASRPWFKKKRFWLLGLLALIIVIVVATSGGDDATPANDTSTGASNDAAKKPAAVEEPAIEVTAETLIADLEANALAASNKYKGKNVIVTGNVSTIDASGDYFSIDGGDDFTLTSVTINIDDSHLDTVSGFSEGQEVTITGKITDVGEIMGYSVDAETIN